MNYQIEKWKQVYAPNPAMVRFQLEQEGYRVFQWSDRANMMFPNHKHDEDQSHWIISGKLEITINGISYLLEAGDRDFMPANTYHSARVAGEEAVVYLVGEKIKVAKKPKKPKKAKKAKIVE